MTKESNQSSLTTIIVAIIGFLGVLVTAYFGYLGIRGDHSKKEAQGPNLSVEEKDWGNETGTSWTIEEEAKRSATAFMNSSEKQIPLVRFDASIFGTRFEIWQKYEHSTVLISDLTLHWDYKPCPRPIEYGDGGAVETHKYRVELTKSRGSKLLDTKKFKYPPGEYDDFFIDLVYPDDGLYQIWLEFRYEILEGQKRGLYQSVKNVIWVCPEMKK